MKKLENTNHNPPSGYELYMNVVDPIGRHWEFAVFPKNAGSVGYFSSLSEYCQWCRKVQEIRSMMQGGKSLIEKVMDCVYTGDLSFETAKRIIDVYKRS